MKQGSLYLALVSLLLLAANPPHLGQWDFEKAEVGKLPPGFSMAKTGRGPGSVWQVLRDKSAPKGAQVLTQTSPQGPNPLFNLCVAEATGYADVDLSVTLKALRGSIDQGGGPVWRYQDENNYYIARMNPLEDNFRLYKVVDARRTQLATADVVAPAGRWHTIRIVHRGDRIRCYLNGKLYLDARDNTFANAGKIGLWTKADAVTSFDGLKVAHPGRSRRKGEAP